MNKYYRTYLYFYFVSAQLHNTKRYNKIIKYIFKMFGIVNTIHTKQFANENEAQNRQIEFL